MSKKTGGASIGSPPSQFLPCRPAAEAAASSQAACRATARTAPACGGGLPDRTLQRSPAVDAAAPRPPGTRRRRARRPGAPAAAGFGLLEALVACGLIVVLAAGVAQLTLASVAAVRASGDETLALLLAVQKVEQLRSLAWGRELVSDAAADPSGAGRRGPSPGASPADSLDRNVPG